MVAAGTGFAPFRGFIEERAIQIAGRRKLAPAYLFVGARHPDQDELYREEMVAWEAMGAVTAKRAFTRAPELSNGHKYVQDALWAEKTLLQQLWEQDARVFVCGSQQVRGAVRKVSIKIYLDGMKERGEDADEARADAWFNRIMNERYATDLFA